MTNISYAIGQRVTVCTGRPSRPVYLTSITKVSKNGTGITTEDGKRWNAGSGRIWGCENERFYSGLLVRPEKEDDAEAIRYGNAVYRIKRFALALVAEQRSAISAAGMEEIVDLIDRKLREAAE